MRWHAFALALALVGPPAARAGVDELTVVATYPARHTYAALRATPIAVAFDRAVSRPSVTAASFRVYGHWTGPHAGTFSFLNLDRTVVFTPVEPFSAGETVRVNLRNTVTAAEDGFPIAAAGFFFQFDVATKPGTLDFTEYQTFLVRTLPGTLTELYGGVAADLNEDGALDLATVNEVSADLRVFLNAANGTGTLGPRLDPPPGLGTFPSPSETTDVDHDGHVDLAIANVGSPGAAGSVSFLFGNGNGTFAPDVAVASGEFTRSLAVLDLDGDADDDVVTANEESSWLRPVLNNGNRTFTVLAPFDAGAAGEYGLAAGDMNEDGLVDLVVGTGAASHRVLVLLATGTTFVPAGNQDVVSPANRILLADVNDDGHLDVTVSQPTSAGASLLYGDGAGGVSPRVVLPGSIGGAVDLGDLDGDGDPDWLVSAFTAREWQLFRNDGPGTPVPAGTFEASSNPGCSILADLDDDGALDLILLDETADRVTLLRNEAGIFGDRFESGSIAGWPSSADP